VTEPRDSAPRATMAVQVPVGPPPDGPDGNPLPMHPQVLEEVLRTLVKALRATAMYLPNNPIYQRAVDATRASFKPVWESVGEVNLIVQELELVWEGQVVYKSTNKNDSVSWLLFKDGIRSVLFRDGVENEELIPFLEVLNRVRTLPQDAEDDLLTLLWEYDFQKLHYQFVEMLQEGAAAPVHTEGTPGLMASAPADDLAAQSNARQQAVQEEAAEAVNKSQVVRLEDFDSTLYFLDEAEVAYVKERIAHEYTQDLRANGMAILYDLFETQSTHEVREEILSILESFPPYLLAAGDLRAVAAMLREAKVLVLRARDLEPEHKDRLESFSAVLSEPAVMEEMLQAIDEAIQVPPEADLTELFRELRGTALEPVLLWLPKLGKEQVRQMLERVVTRLAEGYPAEVHRILASTSEALPGAIALAGRLKMQSAVAGLGVALQHADPAVRLSAAQALGGINSPGALQALEKGLVDADREVRLFAARTAAEKANRGALKAVEAFVMGKTVETVDITERQAFFDAYARIAGSAALAPLVEFVSAGGGLFKKKVAPETRACALLAIAKIKSPEAKAAIQKAAQDKEVVVRNAAARALREAGA
jgi:hypothetical protein